MNPDGTVQTDEDDVVLPTYDQDIVTGFSRVFTGWRRAPEPAPDTPNYLDPLELRATNHETGTKQLLEGVVLPAGQTGVEDMNDALDNIFNHPNVGPFVGTHLIRALVTSNPTPAYVQRVSMAFADNGAGVRGDLRAVVTAILTDPEARGDSKADLNYGRLKEPVQFIVQLLRAMNARSANGATQSDGYLSPQANQMGQDVLRPVSVFSYYPADFLVPGTTDIAGPEFGILSATTTLRRANFVNTMVFNGGIGTSTNAPNGTSLDFSKLQTLSANPQSLVTELNRALLHGSMSPEMQASIVTAVSAVASSNALLRAQQALYLVATSSHFQVQR
jgi:hypothetical protein